MLPVVQASLAFLLGASTGSFINLTAERLPLGQSLLKPPSHCPTCGRRLTPLELIPIFSYIALRGRCYRCRASIPLRVLAVELGLGLFALYLWLTYGGSWASLLLFNYICLFSLFAVIDLEHGVILDVLVYPVSGLSLVLAPWWGHLGVGRDFLGFTAPGYLLLGSLSAGALAAMFFASVILLYPQGMGWGDVKLAGLIGLASGIPGTPIALLGAMLSGGMVATLLLASRRRSRKHSIPFGPFLALGAIMGLLWGNELWGWYLALY